MRILLFCIMAEYYPIEHLPRYVCIVNSYGDGYRSIQISLVFDIVVGKNVVYNNFLCLHLSSTGVRMIHFLFITTCLCLFLDIGDMILKCLDFDVILFNLSVCWYNCCES